MNKSSIDFEKIQSQLTQFYEYSINNGLFFFVTLSSSVEESVSAYLGGARLTNSFLLISIINLKQSELESLSPFLDKRATALFVDVEKKHPFQTEAWTLSTKTGGESVRMNYSNIYAAAFEMFKDSVIIPWSPSRLTSVCAINTLRNNFGGNLCGKHVTVIGLGSVGFKLALGLVEEGCTVSCFSRNIEKTSRLVHSINEVKSPYTISCALSYTDVNTAIASSNHLILAASSKKIIDRPNLLFRNLSSAFILDIGKDSLTLGAKKVVDAMPGLIYNRLDITPEIIQFVSSILSAVPLSSIPQRSKAMVGGATKNVVSGGFPGSVGDLVVDNALDPKFILGYIGDASNYVPDPGVIIE